MDNFQMPHAPPARAVHAGPLDQLEQVIANADDTPFADAFDVVDVADSEVALWRGKQTFAGRLLAADAPVRLTVASGAGISHVNGQVCAVAPPFLLLRCQVGEVFLSLTTIVTAAELPRQGVSTEAFISSKSALRPYLNRKVRIVTTAMTPLTGVLHAVGEDHIDLATSDGRVVAIQSAAIARMDFTH